MAFPSNLVGKVINTVVWQFATEAEITALAQEHMHINIRYNSGIVWYKCIVDANGVKSLVKDTDGALVNVTATNGAKATKTGQTVNVELDLSQDETQSAQITDGKLIVKKLAVDADSANLARFDDVADGGQKLTILRAGRRGNYIRTDATDMAAYVAGTQIGTDNPIAGDTIIFVNSMDTANVGYNQVRFSYETVDPNKTINSFIEHEKDAADTPYTSDSTVITLNPITRKINHNFSTSAKSALKVNINGAAEVIVGTASVDRTNPQTGVLSEITVNEYFNLLEVDVQSVAARVLTLEDRTYTQGTTLDGTQIKIGGNVSETRTTTVQTGGAMNYDASVAGVGTMMSIQKDRVVFGKNIIHVIGQPRWWLNPSDGMLYGIDFDIETGAEWLAVKGVPNL